MENRGTHNMDLVFVSLGQGRKDLGVHSRAIGTLEIVKDHDRYRSVARAAACRPAITADQKLGVFADVVFAELSQCLAIGGEEKLHRLTGLAVCDEGYVDCVKAGNLALRPGTDLYLIVRRDRRLGPDQHFNPSCQLGRKLSRSICRSLGVAAKSGKRKGKDEGTEGLHDGRHNTSIISRRGHVQRRNPSQPLLCYSSKQACCTP